jgi:hypothetical protein
MKTTDMKINTRFLARWAVIGIANGVLFTVAILMASYVSVWPVLVAVLLISGVNAWIQERSQQLGEELIARFEQAASRPPPLPDLPDAPPPESEP